MGEGVKRLGAVEVLDTHPLANNFEEKLESGGGTVRSMEFESPAKKRKTNALRLDQVLVKKVTKKKSSCSFTENTTYEGKVVLPVGSATPRGEYFYRGSNFLPSSGIYGPISFHQV